MKTASKSYAQTIEENLKEFVLEVGSFYERYSREAVDYFDTLTKDKEVIDLGCGDGAATKRFLELGYKVTSVDINPKKLALVDDRATKVECDFLTFLNTAELNNVFCHHALEHVSVPKRVLKGLSRAKGVVFIAVPYQDSLHDVHNTVFESFDELVPPGFKVINKFIKYANTPDKSYWVCSSP